MPRVVTFSPPLLAQLVMQLSMNQMHLPQVGLMRILGRARTMLDLVAGVGIARDANPGNQRDAFPCRLAEAMVLTKTDRLDYSFGDYCHVLPFVYLVT